MGGIRRRLLPGPADNLGDLIVTDPPQCVGPGLVLQAAEPTRGEAPAPLADARWASPDFSPG